jgi:single-stranded DNA-binding protein
VANFGLAVNTRVKDGETWRDGETHFFCVNVWRDQAETSPNPCRSAIVRSWSGS